MYFDLQRFSLISQKIKYINKKSTPEKVNSYNSSLSKPYFNISYQTKSLKGKLAKKMTVKINQANSNPSTCCTYADDAIGMTVGSSQWDEFFGFYPCLFLNGKETKLINPNNYAQAIDKTTLDITSGSSGDVMIAFPRRGLQISTLGDIVTITMSSDLDSTLPCLAHKRGNTIKDKFYLGAYEGSLVDDKLRSLSGKTALASQTLSSFRTYSRANGAPNNNGGSGYDVMGFYQLTYLQAMFILKYKTLNSQSAIGVGFTQGDWSSSARFATTGNTNTKGLNYGSANHEQIKVFGIEDIFGNYCDWIDGLYISSSRNIFTATQGFNDAGSGYTNQGVGASTDLSGYMTKIQGTTEKGFLAKAVQGTDSSLYSNTYYCDDSRLIANCIANYGGYFADLSVAGMFQIHADTAVDYKHMVVGGRLMYL